MGEPADPGGKYGGPHRGDVGAGIAIVPGWRQMLDGGTPAAGRQLSPATSPKQVSEIPQVGVDINGVAGNRGLGGKLPQVNK